MPDDIDRRIVDIMRKDGRRSSAAIGRQLGLSRVAIQNRLQKLVQDQVIEVTVFMNPSRVGDFVSAIIGLDVTAKGLEGTFFELQRHPPVVRVTITHGRFNLLVIAIFRGIDEMSRYLAEVVYRLQGVKTLEVFLLLRLRGSGGPEQGQVSLSALDRRIVEQLQANGRRTTAEIARTLGIDATTVQRRIRRMKEQNLIRVLAMIRQGKVDWVNYAAVGVAVDRARLMEMADKLAAPPSIEHVFFTVGRFDLFLSIEAPSKEAIYEIEDRLSRTEGVRHHELFISLDTKRGPSAYGLHFK